MEQKLGFIVRSLTGGYLEAHSFRDGAMKLCRRWVVKKEHAQVFKLRRNADKAAKRWGGVVEEVSE